MDAKTLIYYYEILLDYLAFSPNITKDLKEIPKEYYSDKQFLLFLKNKFNNVAANCFYPEEVYNNLIIFVDEIYKSLDLNEEEIDELFNDVLSEFMEAMKNTSNNYYYEEYQLKYSKLEDLTQPRCILKDKLIESIRYDYVVMLSLFAPKEEFNRVFENNYVSDNYVLSIKKFLKECPDLFMDEDKEARALKVLVNTYEKKEKNNEDTTEVNKQIYKLMHILKTCKNDYYIEDNLLSFYYNTLLKLKILNNSNHDNYVDDRLLFSAYQLILSNYNCYNFKEKEILSEILFENAYDKRQKLKDNKEELQEFLSVHNTVLTELNTKKITSVGLVVNEILATYGFKNAFSKIRAYNNPNKKDNINKEIIDSILMDQKLMHYYIFGTSLENEEQKSIANSIKKLYKMIPGIFEDDTVYLKTIDLLKENKDHKTLRLIKKYDNHINE